jgi:hypothetical protein
MKFWQLIFSVMDDKRRRGKLKLYYPYDDVGNSESPAPYRLGIATAIINWTMYLLQPEDVLPGQPGIVTKNGSNLINDWIAWESFKRYKRVK